MTILRLASVLIAAAVLAGPSLYGASTQVSSDDPCADRRWEDDDDDEHRRHCEVREERLAPGPLNVDAGRNGGIRVAGWNENGTRIQAIVQTHARSEDRAREIANGVQIHTGGGQVRSVGPDSADLGRREGWSVSFHVNVPRQTDLSLSASNGGITIEGVSGNIEFSTRNGGVRLRDLAGWVHGRTTNGGLNVMLSGQRWDGNGLDVETTNGGVNLAIPDGYSADLETRTVNGGFRTEYPIVLQGELTTRRGITTRLGSGGAPLRVRTTNGGVKITKR